ncbi:predicted protein [Naegleria gruberi]|uniref:Phosphatidate cytidylyltransferase, mitochondrial n=1 Tax=Naegleria gruberi TaxID=5762 RepID=D2V541_NAEGR|nr:uncharacterized protein NAEGRDRAFT_64006 [Naegleria gruberi]EFC48044.1 predicted protein [Naegleria gruberi]|eukprot:XP_002680788.1 predicted protein [Naegleria gruberi strain NEG-M]
MMVDMVLAVSDSYEFHKQNLLLNPEHYSVLMRILGPRVITLLQEKFGARIYYNTMVDLDDIHTGVRSPFLFKYGVIKAQHLIKDLNNWETLYVSGRLQKPTFTIDTIDENVRSLPGHVDTWHQNICLAQEHNLEHALFTALKIILSENQLTNGTDQEQDIKINLFDLFVMIASLSYQGDVRMKIKGAENKNKVTNIVTTNYEHFIELYEPIMEKSKLSIKLDPDTKQSYVNITKSDVEKVRGRDLPLNVQQQLSNQSKITADSIQQAIAKIVSSSSTSQTLKGLISAGPVKSFHYVLEKLKKGLKSHK